LLAAISVMKRFPGDKSLLAAPHIDILAVKIKQVPLFPCWKGALTP
jgi:hypothetical protein